MYLSVHLGDCVSHCQRAPCELALSGTELNEKEL